MITTLNIGQEVIVRCPVYKRGRKYTGVIVSYHIAGTSYKVRIAGNTKSTVFASHWLTPLNVATK